MTRSRLHLAADALSPGGEIVITSDDEAHARYAAASALALWPGSRVTALSGGNAGWSLAGLPHEPGMPRSFGPEDDVWYKPASDLDASAEDIRGYFAWESNLVENIKKDGDARFERVR